MQNSILSLVGAGPGDPELITLKAIKTLQKADVVLYDALANESLLQYAPDYCKTIYVGKRCGQHACSQAAIGHLIIDLSKSHKRIVRLKGGDPGIFGRAQEEIEMARQCGMDLEIIPGISSATGIAGANGFPLTARGYSESIWIATGTTSAGRLSKDLFLAARSSATMVVLMAGRRLNLIQQILVDAGKASTPAAIIANGTTTKQQLVLGKVSNMVQLAREEQIDGPAILLIGHVVSLHPSLWPVTTETAVQPVCSHK